MLPELHVDAQLGPPGRLFRRFQRMSGRNALKARSTKLTQSGHWWGDFAVMQTTQLSYNDVLGCAVELKGSA